MSNNMEFMEVRMRTSWIKMVTYFLAADQLLRRNSAKLPEQNSVNASKWGWNKLVALVPSQIGINTAIECWINNDYCY